MIFVKIVKIVLLQEFLNYWWFFWRFIARLLSPRVPPLPPLTSFLNTQGTEGKQVFKKCVSYLKIWCWIFLSDVGGGLDKATQDLYDLKGCWLGDYFDYIIYNLQFAEIRPSYLNVKVKAKLPKTEKFFPLECLLVLVVLCGCEKEQSRQKDLKKRRLQMKDEKFFPPER